jgi:hypothetical protein
MIKNSSVCSLLIICILSIGDVHAQIQASIGGKTNGGITVDDLLRIGKIQASDSNVVIQSFDLVLPRPDGNVSFLNKGAKFEFRLIAMLSMLSVGDKIHFELIKAKSGETLSRLTPIHFTITKARTIQQGNSLNDKPSTEVYELEEEEYRPK